MDSSNGHNRAQITVTESNNSRTSLIGSEFSNKPLGIRIFGSCFQFSSQESKRTYHKALVLFMTFIAYAAFHMGRRPLSIVKNVLNQNCSSLPDHNASSIGQNETNCSWAPFDDDQTANQLLAYLDSAFLTAYALCMFVSGIIAERTNLRYLITLGSILSGLGLIAFGLARPFDIHSMAFFLTIQALSGAVQSIGWPVVVTCVGNWFGPTKRGLIYGLWNSHTNLGNILGAIIAGFFVQGDWALSFIVPGAIMIAVGLLLFLFLVPTPQDVDMRPPSNERPATKSTQSSMANISGYDLFDQAEQQQVAKTQNDRKAVTFMTAVRIPGVIEYSLCLFFSKLVSYTFLYWLPRYIAASTSNDSEDSAYASTPFDFGGIAGAILAGYVSDKYSASGLTCNAMLLLAIPSMFVYQQYGTYSSLSNIALQALVGALVNGPYCLITTAVSAELGNRVTDGRAMATVSAIIDGMGSLGAVLGPLFAGLVSKSGNWEPVFMMLMISDVLAALCLIRVTTEEIKKKFFKTTIVVDTDQRASL